MNLLVMALRYSGIAWLWRETVQRRKVTLLLFHDISAADALRNFDYLKRHYNIIGLGDYLDALGNGGSLPRKAMVITFDDGHIGNYDLLPVIRSADIPVTIFLCSSVVGTHRHFWFRHSPEVMHKAEELKGLTNNQRIETLKEYGYGQEDEYPDAQALQGVQIESMKPWVDFQSHTRFHPILPQCDDTTAHDEIAGSRAELEEKYGIGVYALAYPNGDYSQRDIDMARAAGYRCGVTVDAGYNDMTSDPYRLRRLSVNDATTTTELMVKASGCYALVKNILRRPAYGFKKNRE